MWILSPDRIGRRRALAATVSASLVALVALTASAQPGTALRVAFYNIRAGQGIQPLRGRAATFADGVNCDNPGKPRNAWGVGAVQRALAELNHDPPAVALGLAEAWFCASPENVRKALGWKSHTGERNGTGLVARYGFRGQPEWLQLDTSQNRSPRDTMWIVRAPVCLDAACARTLDVYAAHWYGTGPAAQETMDRQAAESVRFMSGSRGPHVLVGDLNVFEGDAPVCRQQPNNTSLAVLRRAGYIDAWPAVHGSAEGSTGMLNRAGCGTPEGAPWKRVDYAWSRELTLTAMDRFGLPAPGEAAPSDHAGIVVTYRRQ
jgi:hypothetical protein